MQTDSTAGVTEGRDRGEERRSTSFFVLMQK